MATLPTRENEHAYFYIPNSGDTIVTNSAYCAKCSDEIISVDPVNYTSCKCNNIKIKGGMKSILHQWINPEFYKRRCIVILSSNSLDEHTKKVNDYGKKIQ